MPARPWSPSSSSVPLVDIVAHARAMQPPPRTDLVSTITVYGAAVVATVGFVIASVVDELLSPRRTRSRTRPGPFLRQPIRQPT